MSEQDYFQQFVGQDVPPGTRYRTSHVHPGGKSGVAHDCITAQSALDESIALNHWKNYWQHGNTLELIEISPQGIVSWQRETVIARFELVDRDRLELK